MNKFDIQSKKQTIPADTLTPVAAYLRLRDAYPEAVLLEATDARLLENSFSYICLEPMAEFRLEQQAFRIQLPDGTLKKGRLPVPADALAALESFKTVFKMQLPVAPTHSHSGLFGYSSYEAIRYFENIELPEQPHKEREMPDMLYRFYRYVLVFNHFKDELYIYEHGVEGQHYATSTADLLALLEAPHAASHGFELRSEEQAYGSEADFLAAVAQGKNHCQRGDVFQVVLSRSFSQAFKGDEFEVYRRLRSINPSPYLFFFDFGNFKIFGSSPEAQLIVKNSRAEIHPIAGTFRRTGNDAEDAAASKALFEDPKETAEHVMLVDLARNDLSRNGKNVKVETYKEIQYFSHLIHLVSKVAADIRPADMLKIFADTFPAGTLSGAPKYKALEIIYALEPHFRGYYGGAIGFMDFEGRLNHAIMIRSFLSKNFKLHYQAGAGIVSQSVPEKELAEVAHKLGALRKAMLEAAK
ncbi:MAG: anthranilate synthase component I family protein [Bernardetiaceae bacterium]|nr:anthranilate synthase component I family protein [Bernardetiaceae bacterium]